MTCVRDDVAQSHLYEFNQILGCPCHLCRVLCCLAPFRIGFGQGPLASERLLFFGLSTLFGIGREVSEHWFAECIFEGIEVCVLCFGNVSHVGWVFHSDARWREQGGELGSGFCGAWILSGRDSFNQVNLDTSGPTRY